MEPIKISSPGEAMMLLHRAVSAKGTDFVYNESGENSCHYFEDDNKNSLGTGAQPTELKPGCIIGQVLANAGFDPAAEPDLARSIEGNDVGTLARGHAYGNFPPLIQAPPVVIEMLLHAQRAQDEGESWGTALRVAHAVQRGAEQAQANA
jgi:hypothetical protein